LKSLKPHPEFKRINSKYAKRTILFIIPFLILVFSFKILPTKIVFKTITASVSGSSSLHPWKSEISRLDATGSFQIKDNIIKSVKDVRIFILVKNIKSKEGKVMDNKTWEAFKYEKYPNIVCTFSLAAVKIASDKAVLINIPGKLTMAGVSRSIDLAATGIMLSNGDLELHVSKKLKMTDYGMIPPKAVLGTIKVGDEVTIEFNMILTR
jgi:polyisoprenoid-binding protein YceI